MKRIFKFITVFCLMMTMAFSLVGCVHEHSYNKVVVNPTQNSLGYDKYVCSCGDVSYKDNYTCLITYQSMAHSGVNLSTVPQSQNVVVAQNSQFNGVEGIGNFMPVEYRLYSNETNYTSLYCGQLIQQSCNVAVVWDNTTRQKSTNEMAFDELISKIELLENISKQYNADKNLTKNPILRAMQYIRYTRYNDIAWNLLAGSVESDFINYVQNNQGSVNLSTLQTMQNIVVPKTGEEIDFVHMIGVMNVACNSSVTTHSNVDLAGWIGDLCQLAGQIDQMALTTDEEIYSKCEDLFGATAGSTFSIYDLIADQDSINIMKLYEDLNISSIAKVMKNYYNSLNVNNRKNDFLKVAANGYNTETAIKTEMYARIYNSPLMTMWCDSINFDLTLEKSKKIVNYLVDLCIDYLLNN